MKVSTPDLCDNYGDEVTVLAPGLRHYGALKHFSGQIATVKCFEDNSKVGDMLRTEGRGRVLVVDGGASLRCSLLGDKLAANGIENGWSGVVVNGCVRDVEDIGQMPIAVMALATVPRKTEKRGVGEIDIVVNFCAVDIRPGDYLYADESGVIISENSLVVAPSTG